MVFNHHKEILIDWDGYHFGKLVEKNLWRKRLRTSINHIFFKRLIHVHGVFIVFAFIASHSEILPLMYKGVNTHIHTHAYEYVYTHAHTHAHTHISE